VKGMLADIQEMRRMTLEAIAREEADKAAASERWKDNPEQLAYSNERPDRWLAYYRNQLVILDFMAEHGRYPRRSEVTQEAIL